jgi:hypothetical protein
VDRDSIIFEKGTGENRIIYFMKKVYPKRWARRQISVAQDVYLIFF